jgi:diguanylate cyclase
VDPALLVAEITETALLDLNQGVHSGFARLSATGIGIALDDFGTGYSSLTHLRGLPVDVLKIDRSFVQRVTEDARDLAIIRSLVSLAGVLGLRTIAEGVEREDQKSILRELGCEAAQGFGFSLPCDAAACEALLAAGRVDSAWSRADAVHARSACSRGSESVCG